MKPNVQISRQEVAALIANILRLQAAENSPEIQKLKDVKDSNTWAKGAIGAVLEHGYMKGYTDQTFKMGNPITRAEATVALSNVAGIIYNKEGTYGNDTVTTVNGNVSVNKSGVNLKNISIKGNLYLTEGIGNGNVALENVTVSGKTLVCGGMESIIIKNSTLGATVVQKKDGKVRLEANGSTKFEKVELRSEGKLEEKDLTGAGFGSVEIKDVKDAASTIQLDGNFDDVNVGSAAQVELVKGSVNTLQATEGSKNAGITVLSGTVASLNIMAVVNVDIKAGTVANVVVSSVAAGANVKVQAGAIVTSLKTDAAIQVSGTGKIENAQVNVEGVKFEVAPVKLDTASSVAVQIGDVVKTPAPTAKATTTASSSSSGSSGGGSSSGGSKPTPPSITVSNDGSIIEGKEDSEELTVSLSNDTFVEANVNKTNITMEGMPEGVTVGEVVYASLSQINIILSGNSIEDYDTDKTVTVTVKLEVLKGNSGDVTATIVFVATVEVTGVTLDKETITLDLITNKTATIKATITPSNAANKNVTWAASNEDVATVNASGVVTVGTETGTATITVTTVDGNKTATVTVNVYANTEAAAISAINEGKAVLEDYETAGIIGVFAGNLADVNAAVAIAKAKKGSDLTKEEIQGAVATVVDAAD
jgi:hypothetical protein